MTASCRFAACDWDLRPGAGMLHAMINATEIAVCCHAATDLTRVDVAKVEKSER
jgi:hypothetical protein